MNESDLRELYQEVIMNHNKYPHNKGCLDNCTHDAEGDNPLCGDQVHIYLRLNNSIIESVTFEGEGCAISVASASILTKLLKGKSAEVCKKLSNYFQKVCTQAELSCEEGIEEFSTLDMEELTLLSSVKQFPARVKCATLAWHTFDQAIKEKE